MYLVPTGIWVAWRHRFSCFEMVPGIVASVTGMIFFGAYLLFQFSKANGVIHEVLPGKDVVSS